MTSSFGTASEKRVGEILSLKCRKQSTVKKTSTFCRPSFSIPSLIFNQIISQENLTVVSTNEKAKLQVEICLEKHTASADSATVIKHTHTYLHTPPEKCTHAPSLMAKPCINVRGLHLLHPAFKNEINVRLTVWSIVFIPNNCVKLFFFFFTVLPVENKIREMDLQPRGCTATCLTYMI